MTARAKDLVLMALGPRRQARTRLLLIRAEAVAMTRKKILPPC